MAITPKLFQKMSKLLGGKMAVGRYEVRLAETEQEIQASQRLRYDVLFKEKGGQISEQMQLMGREVDEWDPIAYHVLVFDNKNDNAVVGTMRLVNNYDLQEGQLFYTEHAFDLSGLRQHYPSVLELSRACVSPEGRGGAILMLIWKFTMQFIEQNNIDVMMGCASFSGTDYTQHVDILSYLHEKHLADAELMPKPVIDNYVPIKEFKRTVGKGKGRGKVPTMLRGYLKIGARISEDAIIDPVFNTTFVVIYVDAKQMFGSNHALVYKSN